jgi:hypothetical protein
MDSATLTLTGGDYFFDSLRVRENGQLRFAAPSTVHVTGKVRIGAAAVVAPEPGSGMGAQDIVLWVAETDSSPGPPMAFFGGENAQLTLNLYAFNGTVTLGEATQGTGSFLGLRVHVKAESVLNVDSAFESPSP